MTLACYYISTNLSLPLDITLVISLKAWGRENVTLASYSILLIPYCHKKKYYIFWGIVLPPSPRPTAILENAKVYTGPTSISSFWPPLFSLSISPPLPYRISISPLYFTFSSELSPSPSPSLPSIYHYVIVSCLSVMSSCHVILSYILIQSKYDIIMIIYM